MPQLRQSQAINKIDEPVSEPVQDLTQDTTCGHITACLIPRLTRIALVYISVRSEHVGDALPHP